GGPTVKSLARGRWFPARGDHVASARPESRAFRVIGARTRPEPVAFVHLVHSTARYGPNPVPYGHVLQIGRSAAREHCGDRPDHDLEVEPDRPAIDVGEVELHPSIEVLLAPRLDLPQAGDPGLHRQPAAVPQVVARDLAGERRPRANEA